MLGDHDSMATVGVKDLAKARQFYEGKLSLKPTGEQEPGSLSYKTGKSTLFVYESRYAGTNQATAVTFVVGDQVESIVRALKAKGVAFEHYDLPPLRREGDLHVGGDMKVAWFKDPDGNIISVAGT